MDEQTTQPEQQTDQDIESGTASPQSTATEAPVVATAATQGGGKSGTDSHNGHDPYAPRTAPDRTGNIETDMGALLAASDEQFRQLKYGDVIEGTIMRKDAEEILVDIGSKSEGIIPNNELQSLTPDEFSRLAIGDEVLVSVLQPEDKEGHVVLSLDRARQEKSWRRLQKQFENNEVIEAEVTGYNKGGLLVNLEGVRGFVPASQVTGLSSGGTDAAKQSELSRFTTQKLSLKIIEINRNRNRLILSERQAAQEQRDHRKEQLLAELTPGQIRDGHVSSICDFGAFVDIGGADGLIHLSELSWSRVNHPSEVLKVGAPVKVFVMSVDEKDRKIALSLKRTQPEPWSQVMDHYHLGQLVRGTITQLTDFGAFARLEDGIEGLIHVSELAEGRVTHPRNIVQEGWELTLRVIRIDPQRRRMGLSLRRAMEAQDDDTLPPQEALPAPTPRGSGDGEGGRGGRGGPGGRGGRGPRREEEAGTGADGAVAQAGAPVAAPAPAAVQAPEGPAPSPQVESVAAGPPSEHAAPSHQAETVAAQQPEHEASGHQAESAAAEQPPEAEQPAEHAAPSHQAESTAAEQPPEHAAPGQQTESAVAAPETAAESTRDGAAAEGAASAAAEPARTAPAMGHPAESEAGAPAGATGETAEGAGHVNSEETPPAYSAEMGPGPNVTPASDAEGDDTDTAT